MSHPTVFDHNLQIYLPLKWSEEFQMYFHPNLLAEHHWNRFRVLKEWFKEPTFYQSNQDKLPIAFPWEYLVYHKIEDSFLLSKGYTQSKDGTSFIRNSNLL